MSIDVICAAISFACAIILITHCKYEEGFVGRVALILLGISEVVVLAQAWHSDTYDYAPTTILRHVAVTIFLTRHTYKFLFYHYCGKYSWDRRGSHREAIKK